MFSSEGLSIPTNRVPATEIRLDNNIAVAMMSAPIHTDTDIPVRSGPAARFPW